MPSIKLINQGTYGCVYHPGIKCNGKVQSEKFVTKIQKNDNTVQNEIRIGKIVKTIPQFSRYFAPIIDSCPAKISKRAAEGCGVIEAQSSSSSSPIAFVSNKIRYVGKQTLTDYIMHGDKDKIRERYIRTQKRLRRAIDKLTEHGLVHFDVKYNNIMYDERIKEPVFIDFGLSIRIDDVLGVNGRDKLSQTFYTFNTYDYWPVEVCMFGYAFSGPGTSNNRITATDIDLVLDVFVNGREDKNGIKTPNSFMETVNKSQFMRDAHDYFDKYVGKTWLAMYDEMMAAGVWKRWDKYGLDVTYAFIDPELKPKVQLLPSQ
jgi:serine/threonine protein kinase